MCDVIFFDISFTRECVGFRVLSAFDHFNIFTFTGNTVKKCGDNLIAPGTIPEI